MKAPSDAQAALLALIAGADGDVEWFIELDPAWDRYRPGRASLVIERFNRDANTSSFDPADDLGRKSRHRVVTVEACERHGWLSLLHERRLTIGGFDQSSRREILLRQCDLTEDGVIALGLWRERKLKAPPPEQPQPTEREAELIRLAQRALDLGYALVQRKPARTETRRMRKAGWWGGRGVWIANSAVALVPSAQAVVAVLPDRADRPASPEESLHHA